MTDGERTSTDADEWSPDDLSTETGLRIAADPHRRSLLQALFESEDGRLPLDELARRVRDGVDEDAERSRREVAAVLRHSHLPKLAENDVVVLDDEADTVALSTGAADLRPLLTFIDTDA